MSRSDIKSVLKGRKFGGALCHINVGEDFIMTWGHRGSRRWDSAAAPAAQQGTEINEFKAR
jgi:hypothetical protein